MQNLAPGAPVSGLPLHGARARRAGVLGVQIPEDTSGDEIYSLCCALLLIFPASPFLRRDRLGRCRSQRTTICRMPISGSFPRGADQKFLPVLHLVEAVIMLLERAEQRPPTAPLDPRQENPTRGQVRGRGAAERVAFEHGDVHADRLQHAETTLGDPLGPQTLGGLPHISGEEGGRVGAVLPYTPDQSACGISRHTELPARAAFCARADKKFLVRPPLVVVVVPLVHPKIAHTKAMVEDKKDFGLNQSDPDPTQTPPRPEV